MTTTSMEDGDNQSFKQAQAALLDYYGTEATSRFVQLDDPPLECHFLDVGQGGPVVILHGGGGMAAQMDPLLGRLGNQFNIIAPDRPGCGLTESFEYTGVDFRQHGVGFLRSLWDALGIDQASIVASSIAGVWAIGFALAHPNRVKNIAFLGAPAGLTPKIPLPLRLAGTPVIGNLLFRTALGHSKANYRQQLQSYVVDADTIPPELVEATYASMSTPNARQSFKTMVQEVTTLFGFKSKYVLREQLADVEQPALFVWGSDDPVHPISAGRQAAERVPNARFELINGAATILIISDSANFRKGTRDARMTAYRFRVKFAPNPTSLWRDIVVGADRTIVEFQSTLNPAVGLDQGHLWFVGDDEAYWDSEVKYQCPREYEMQPEGDPGVRTERLKNAGEVTVGEMIQQLGLEQYDRICYLYDYGDEWRFYGVLKEALSDEPNNAEPTVVNSEGESIDQFGSQKDRRF